MPCHKQWNINKCACLETCKTLAVILVFSLFIHFKSMFIWLLENPPSSLKFFRNRYPLLLLSPRKITVQLKKKNLMDHIILWSALSSTIGMAFLINLRLNKTQYIPWEHHGKSPHNLFALINESPTGQEKREWTQCKQLDLQSCLACGCLPYELISISENHDPIHATPFLIQNRSRQKLCNSSATREMLRMPKHTQT